MDPHKYRIGEVVTYQRQYAHRAEQGLFKIELLMPANAVENQYRILRSSDGQRRLAGESELVMARGMDDWARLKPG